MKRDNRRSRECFRLMVGTSDEDVSDFGSVDYELVSEPSTAAMKSTSLYKGRALSDEFALKRRFFVDVDGCGFPDFVDTSAGWILCSPRVVEMFQKVLETDTIQWINPVFRNGVNCDVSGYKVINVLRHIECMDRVASIFDEKKDGSVRLISLLAVKADVLPRDAALFRLKENPHYLLATEELVGVMRDAAISGVRFSDEGDCFTRVIVT